LAHTLADPDGDPVTLGAHSGNLLVVRIGNLGRVGIELRNLGAEGLNVLCEVRGPRVPCSLLDARLGLRSVEQGIEISVIDGEPIKGLGSAADVDKALAQRDRRAVEPRRNADCGHAPGLRSRAPLLEFRNAPLRVDLGLAHETRHRLRDDRGAGMTGARHSSSLRRSRSVFQGFSRGDSRRRGSHIRVLLQLTDTAGMVIILYYID
jgi:hypothetical protein